MNDTKNFVHLVFGCWPFVGLSVAGAAVRCARFGFPGLWQFGASAVTAAFSGLLISLTLISMDVEPGIVGSAAGIVGYSGGAVLDAFLSRAIRAANGEDGVVK